MAARRGKRAQEFSASATTWKLPWSNFQEASRVPRETHYEPTVQGPQGHLMNEFVSMPIGRHFGTVLRSTVVGRFTLTETRYAPGFRTTWHRHDAAAFCLVLGGAYVERSRRAEIECRRWTVLFRPRGTDHEDRISQQGAVCCIIEPQADWLDEVRMDLSNDPHPLAIAAARAHWILSQARQEFRHPDVVSPLALEGLVLALVAEAARARTARPGGGFPGWLRRTRELLDARFAEHHTLADLAREAGVHPVHLASAFRRAFGASVGEYIRCLRVEAARRALLDCDRTVSEVALEIGFSSHSHLTSVFRRHTGVTPSEYRRQAGGA
jgi:AraC family transcriptional regulator